MTNVAETDLLRRLFDAMPQLGWTAQPDGFIDYYNRGWYEYSGTTYEEMKGWGWQSIHHPDELPRVMESWGRSIATGKPWEIEFPLRRRDGVYRWFLSRATPIYDEAGTLIRWVGINTDIDDQKRAERQLAELDRAKTTFFSNVSHELRTPLTLILGPLEVALQSPARTLSGPALHVARRNALRLLKLVNTLLDFSRLEAGRGQVSYVETELGGLTRDLASSFRSAVEAAGLEFVVDCPTLDVPVYVDHEMWEKVVFNLLSNALKFTFRGRIAVSLAQDGTHAVLAVSDTGTGIPEQEQDRVFERFLRITGARARTHEGSGIGLALVKEIVRMHGGTVDVTSAPGEGSTFCVRIPLGKDHLPADRIGTPTNLVSTALGAGPYVQEAMRWFAADEGAIEANTSMTCEPVPDDVVGARILVADDNADMREYLVRLLGSRWKVEAVVDGSQALAAARRQPPDLILTDVMMSNVDGLELLRALRLDDRLRTVPVIVLSARAGEDARVEGLEVGADDYLVKPFSARELVARIAAQLQIARLRYAAVKEHETLRHLFTQSPVPVAMYTGPEHRIEFASPSFCEMSGRSELVGRTVREAFPEIPFDHPSIAALDQAYASGETVSVNEMLVPLRGSGPESLQDHWFNYVVRPLRDPSSGANGLMVVATDITTQVLSRKAVEKARQDAERYQMLLATAQRVAHIGIFDWQLRTNEMYWSPELYRLLEFLPGEVTAAPARLAERMFPEDVEHGREEFRHACARQDVTLESEQRLLLADGSSRWIRVSGQMSYDDQGQPSRVIGAVVDIQSLKELAERERMTRLEAEAANRTKDEFLAMLGHELRNPLSPILTAIQLIRLRGSDGIAREVNVIERQAHHLIRLVDDLLDISRITRGMVVLSKDPVEISDVIAAAIETASPMIENARHSLVTDIPKHGLVVSVDRVRMVQVIANLLTNAAKYTPSGGRICVAARRVDGCVRISVEDNGSGIAPELLPHVFDLFVQARQTIARSQGGLGIGLSIVKTLVNLHGGTVFADSNGIGQGSIFTVVLPDLDFIAATEEAATPIAVAEPRHQRVLIVDDNRDAAEMLSEVVQMLGYPTAVAHDGPEALKIAGQLHPQLALLDIGLPVMDGYELAQRLRADSTETLTMIAITGYGQETDRKRSHEAGFTHHMTKPVDLEKLARLLEHHLPGREPT